MYMKELKPAIRQQKPVYHEMTFFLASGKPQKILDFGKNFHSMGSNPQNRCTNTGALHTQLPRSYTFAKGQVQILYNLWLAR